MKTPDPNFHFLEATLSVLSIFLQSPRDGQTFSVKSQRIKCSLCGPYDLSQLLSPAVVVSAQQLTTPKPMADRAPGPSWTAPAASARLLF